MDERGEQERRENGVSVSLFRVVAFLVVYTTALIAGVSWILTSSFTNALDSRLDRMALQAAEVYAKKAEIVPRGEMEIRFEMLRQELGRMKERDAELRKSLDDHVREFETIQSQSRKR